MEKDEAVKLLAKKGYKTVYDHGVPIVLTEGQITKKMYNEIESLLRSSGYESSFGVKGNQKIEMTEEEPEKAENEEVESVDENEEVEVSDMETEVESKAVDNTDEDDSYYFDEADSADEGESTIYNADMFGEDENGQLTFDSFLND